MVSLISVQINGKSQISENIAAIQKIVKSAVQEAHSQRLVVLPECASIFGVSGAAMLAHAEPLGEGPIQSAFSELAKQYSCYLVAGSTPILSATNKNKFTASSLVFGPDGARVAVYNKIHLFDVEVADNTQSYLESKYTEAGKYLSIVDTEFAQIGLSICYDLRFAPMYSALSNYTVHKQAPEIIVVPSAFTRVTGKAHWHALLQARSIENQSFVVASNQTGVHADGRETYGNSCIYSPWGECIDLITSGEGFAIANFDSAKITEIRKKMPIHLHKKERYQIEF